MSIIDNLIYDRTQGEVNRLIALIKKGWAGMSDEEKSEYLTSRGAYNATDLNRVEAAVKYVADYLNGLQDVLNAYGEAADVAPDEIFNVPYETLELDTVTTWASGDIPTKSEMERYLDNVNKLTDAVKIEKDLPESMEKLTWQGANEIERSIKAEWEAGHVEEARIKTLMDKTAEAWFYCGDVFGGEI